MKKSLEQRTEEESYDSVISIESSKVPFRLIRNFYVKKHLLLYFTVGECLYI